MRFCPTRNGQDWRPKGSIDLIHRVPDFIRLRDIPQHVVGHRICIFTCDRQPHSLNGAADQWVALDVISGIFVHFAVRGASTLDLFNESLNRSVHDQEFMSSGAALAMNDQIGSDHL